jgi:hypothetical protein
MMKSEAVSGYLLSTAFAALFISMSVGMCEMNVFIAPADLIRAAGAIVAQLTR